MTRTDAAGRRPAHLQARTGSELVQEMASQHVGRGLSALALVAATVAGVWIGVNAPETSPVSPPQAVGQQAPPGATP
jgi:hypothetical protein